MPLLWPPFADVPVAKTLDDLKRLKEDIEKSRASYLEKVGADLAGTTDYFRDELVATLAEGDAEALGAGR